MKSKLVVGLSVIALLLCQGIAFAETAKDATAVAEDMIVTEDSANGITDETLAAEKSVNGVARDAVVEEELVAPAVEPEKEPATEAKETTEETEKM
jgi:hypothetical protein